MDVVVRLLCCPNCTSGIASDTANVFFSLHIPLLTHTHAGVFRELRSVENFLLGIALIIV
jgi:hypothetical protein